MKVRRFRTSGIVAGEVVGSDYFRKAYEQDPLDELVERAYLEAA